MSYALVWGRGPRCRSVEVTITEAQPVPWVQVAAQERRNGILTGEWSAEFDANNVNELLALRAAIDDGLEMLRRHATRAAGGASK